MTYGIGGVACIGVGSATRGATVAVKDAGLEDGATIVGVTGDVFGSWFESVSTSDTGAVVGSDGLGDCA